MVNVTIDGKKIQVPERTRILDAARMAGVQIPTLQLAQDGQIIVKQHGRDVLINIQRFQCLL